MFPPQLHYFLFAAILCTAAAAAGQLPPVPPSLPFTNYFAVESVSDGTNHSLPSNEVWWTNGSVLLTWSNSPTPNVTYRLLSGRQSGVYTRTNDAGTNTTLLWPPPPPPIPPPVFVFEASTDLLHWSDLHVYTGSVAEPQRFFKIVHRKS
jgi:hypothetical protein